MNRGGWWATVHGVARVGYDLATKATNELNFEVWENYAFIEGDS